MTDVPHFDFPFRFVTLANGDVVAAVNEQHSDEDVTACITAIVATPLGERDELPDFGIEAQLFQDAPLDVEQIRSQIEAWEDRADLSALTYVDSADALVQYFRVSVAPQTEEQS